MSLQDGTNNTGNQGGSGSSVSLGGTDNTESQGGSGSSRSLGGTDNTGSQGGAGTVGQGAWEEPIIQGWSLWL